MRLAVIIFRFIRSYKYLWPNVRCFSLPLSLWGFHGPFRSCMGLNHAEIEIFSYICIFWVRVLLCVPFPFLHIYAHEKMSQEEIFLVSNENFWLTKCILCVPHLDKRQTFNFPKFLSFKKISGIVIFLWKSSYLNFYGRLFKVSRVFWIIPQIYFEVFRDFHIDTFKGQNSVCFGYTRDFDTIYRYVNGQKVL